MYENPKAPRPTIHTRENVGQVPDTKEGQNFGKLTYERAISCTLSLIQL